MKRDIFNIFLHKSESNGSEGGGGFFFLKTGFERQKKNFLKKKKKKNGLATHRFFKKKKKKTTFSKIPVIDPRRQFMTEKSRLKIKFFSDLLKTYFHNKELYFFKKKYITEVWW